MKLSASDAYIWFSDGTIICERDWIINSPPSLDLTEPECFFNAWFSQLNATRHSTDEEASSSSVMPKCAASCFPFPLQWWVMKDVGCLLWVWTNRLSGPVYGGIYFRVRITLGTVLYSFLVFYIPVPRHSSNVSGFCPDSWIQKKLV